MNKKKFVISLIVAVILVLAITVGVAAKTKLAVLEIRNRSDQPVSISLTSGDIFYYLTVPADSTQLFTVEREVYDRTTWSCGAANAGTVDIKTFLHLTFTKCFGKAPNSGEPGFEKVHIDDAPSNIADRYK
jgi:hypothetical protein